MATKNVTLEKFYISEKFDENRNISFNLKKANQKSFKNFENFSEALTEFIELSEKSKNNTRVWFHRDGAYRGSVGLEKAKLILEKVTGEKVKNEEAIDYLEKENLVEKTLPKKPSKISVKKDNEEHVEFSSENLPKSVFGLEKIYNQAIFDAILSERGSRRLATHKTKTRGEVSGSGKKPWDQKHTGNARAGSLLSLIHISEPTRPY